MLESFCNVVTPMKNDGRSLVKTGISRIRMLQFTRFFSVGPFVSSRSLRKMHEVNVR
jgi:hypothetical protein